MTVETLRIQYLDGSHLDVVPNLFDQRNFERTLRNNRQWGAIGDNALKLSAFRAWSAATRLELISLTWDEFYESPHTPIHSVLPVTEDDAEEETDPETGESLEVPGLGKDTPPEPSASHSSLSQ